ncbi:MAG: phosphotransferase family protein [Erysipelotrichaceae bacterium]|nr:phosphotransferase family protein [Erysipelotrichaceae bacterium]
MKLHQLITELFQSSTYTLKDTKKGLTNRNFLLTVNQKQYMLRLPYEDTQHFLDRKQEAHVLEMINNLSLDVHLIYFNIASGIKITTFIPHLEEFENSQYKDKIERVAKLMKKLHTASYHCEQDFQPIETWKRYYNRIQHPIYDLSNFLSILQDVQNLHNPNVLCHNDWVSGNILLGESKDYLIDFEYAANNDPLFDVMSFITENHIDNEQDRERFYQVYFDTMTPTLQRQLLIWEIFHHLLWCTWAMMMYEARNNPTFLEIAHQKYHALTISFQKKDAYPTSS